MRKLITLNRVHGLLNRAHGLIIRAHGLLSRAHGLLSRITKPAHGLARLNNSGLILRVTVSEKALRPWSWV